MDVKRSTGGLLRIRLLAAFGLILIGAGTAGVFGQALDTNVGCVPVAERAGRELGCFIVGSVPLGRLDGMSYYWYIDRFDSKAAAQKLQSSRGAVIEAAGRVWLFTIGHEGWQPAGGKRVAAVGPLEISKTAEYTAMYMEAAFMPGMQSRVHRHPGPEAWYVLEGEQCLEIPSGTIRARAGESAVVPAGPPMQMSGTGSGRRTALVLILHDSSQEPIVPASDWTPTGACLKGQPAS
jgi:quercetin dioxygenase-like cupin family protein